MNKKYKIYLITNTINNKVYVGFTRNIEKRFREHKLGHKTGNMGRAMKELGSSNFSIQVIDSTDCMFEAMYVTEPYWIGRYNSIETGYNGAFHFARPLHYGETRKFFLNKKSGKVMEHNNRIKSKSAKLKNKKKKATQDELDKALLASAAFDAEFRRRTS